LLKIAPLNDTSDALAPLVLARSVCTALTSFAAERGDYVRFIQVCQAAFNLFLRHRFNPPTGQPPGQAFQPAPLTIP
jgi:hypothetical protein